MTITIHQGDHHLGQHLGYLDYMLGLEIHQNTIHSLHFQDWAFAVERPGMIFELELVVKFLVKFLGAVNSF